jgi:ribosomal protein S18 acetylase RimI-like enzyme
VAPLAAAVSAAAIPVTRADADAVAAAVARGFHDNEIWCWLIPGEERRIRLMTRLYRARLRHVYLRHGHAYTVEGNLGGAFWLPPGPRNRTFREELAEAFALLPGIGPRGARRGMRMEALLQRHHPSEPHWYLEVLSIDPAHQRQGHGATLMAPALARCDADRVPAFLETNRESNLPYYRRFGFELTEEISLDDSPPLWLMWREPRDAR